MLVNEDDSVTGLLIEQQCVAQDYDITQDPPAHLREEQQEFALEKDDSHAFITFRPRTSPKEDQCLDFDSTNSPKPKDEMRAASES